MFYFDIAYVLYNCHSKRIDGIFPMNSRDQNPIATCPVSSQYVAIPILRNKTCDRVFFLWINNSVVFCPSEIFNHHFIVILLNEV